MSIVMPKVITFMMGGAMLAAFGMFGTYMATQIENDKKSKKFESIVSSSPEGQVKSLSFEGINTTIDKTEPTVKISLHDFPAKQCMLVKNIQHHIRFHHKTALIIPPTSMVIITSNRSRGSASSEYKCESDHNDAEASYTPTNE